MIWDFFKSHWRPLLALVLIAAAFMVGRYTTPGPEVVVAQSIRFVERKVEVASKEKTKTVVVYRDRVVKPDGTRVEHEVERSVDDVKTAKTVESSANLASEEKQTVSAYKPQWRVGVLIGANVGGIRFDRPVGWDLLAAGAYAERRLVGPFWIGVWGLSTGPSFGLTLGGEF